MVTRLFHAAPAICLILHICLVATGLLTLVGSNIAGVASGLLITTMLLWSLWRDIGDPQRMGCMQRAFVLWASAAVLVGVCAIAQYYAHNPWGGWDAWAMWNARARGIFLNRTDWLWQLTHSMPKLHPDYPPLLPVAIVGGWILAGQETTVVPFVVGLISYCGLCGTMYLAIGQFSRITPNLRAAAVAVFAVTPHVVSMSASQYADVPITFYAFFGLVALRIGIIGNRRIYRILGGTAVGMAACTKNEGMVMAALVALIALYWVLSHANDRRDRVCCLRDLALGMAPWLLALWAYRGVSLVPNDLVANQTVQNVFRNLTDPSRHFVILKYLVAEVLCPSHWGLCGPLIVGCVVYGSWVHGRLRSKAMLLMAIGLLTMYYIVYLVTPYELSWHLNTSLSRTMLHLYPFAYAFAILQFARSPVDSTVAPLV